jgi:hypothetical protein
MKSKLSQYNNGTLNTVVIVLGCIIGFVLGAILFGCTECKTADLTCHGDKIEICNATKQWEEVVNCAELEPGEWVCVEVDTDQGTLYPVDCVERVGE